MEKITKKDIKQIKKGNHAVLMDCLELLLDSYNEAKWDLGYSAALADMGVMAGELAQHIHKVAEESGHKEHDFDSISYLEKEELAQTIQDFFNKTIDEQ